ncbi:ABC transporter permease [Clostridium sp. SGI.024]|nr:ABC transporter permease [Clostridium sp.]
MAVVIRIIKQTINDKRTLALMMIAPLIVLSLVYVLFNSGNDIILNVGIYNVNSDFKEALNETDLKVIDYSEKDNIESKIKGDDLSAFIYMDDVNINVTYENSSPQNTNKIKAIIKNISIKTNIINLTKKITSMNSKINFEDNGLISEKYLYGDEDTSYFDTITPMLIGFFVFFFVFLVSGISLLKERTSGTLYKLLATPIKRSEIVIGYLLGYGVFAFFQSIIIVVFAVYVLNIKVVGSIYLVLLSNIIIAFVALSLGILLSTFANSEFQMVQFIPIVIVPQIFFGGIIPIESMATWLQKVSYLMPLRYGAEALKGIILKGYNFTNIQNNIITLILFIVVLCILNVICLKKYRRI